MPHNVALFDMDGTLCDLQGAMLRDLKKLAGPKEKSVQDVHDKRLPQYVKNRINMIKQSHSWWEQLEELKLGFDILRAARQAGYEIHILTKGPSTSLNAYTEKVKWVKAHIPDAKITITDNKGMVYGKILVEDHPVFIQHWLKYRVRGLVIMPKNKINRFFKHPQVIVYDGKNLAQVKRALHLRLKVPEIDVM